jgi:hypothetical protein
VAEFDFVWLRALAHTCGPMNRPVSSIEVAGAFPEVERVVGRVTSQAAAASLTRLAARGLAEVEWDEGRKRWRLTDAGVQQLTDASSFGSLLQPATPPVHPAPETTLSGRLADLVRSYTSGDLGSIGRALSYDVVLFIPGFTAIAGTYAGQGQVISLLNKHHTPFLSDLRVVERVDEAEEARVRVVARASGPAGEPEEVELWIRATADFDGLIVQAMIQPEDQGAFDAAVERNREGPGE